VIGGPFKIDDQAKDYVIKAGQAGVVLTGEAIDKVMVMASSSDPNANISKIVDGSGLQDRNNDGLPEHSANPSDMWLSAKGQITGWIEFDLGNPRILDGIEVWNYNQSDGTRRGIQKADISVWTKEAGWKKVKKDFEFDRASIGDEYDDPTFINMDAIAAAKVKFDEIKNFDDVNYVGLSEVRFYEVAGPQAVRPLPADGGLCDGKKVTLAWMPGNGAQSHKVYLGADANNLEFIGEKAGSGLMSAQLSNLSRNTKYFWRVDEVDADGTVISGKVWSFTGPALAGWWKFDEENGSVAKDSSDNARDGTLRGNCVWKNTAGKFGGAIELDGASGYIEIANADTFNFTDEMTISAWVNTDEVKNAWAGIVTRGDDAWRLTAMRNEIKPHFSVSHYSNTYIDGTKAVSAGQWHHFAGVYDGQFVRLYIDGQQDSKREWDGPVAGNDFKVLIGENDQIRGRFWKGMLDDVRIYNYALPKEDIQTVFEGGQPQDSLVRRVQIKFNEPLKPAKREK